MDKSRIKQLSELCSRGEFEKSFEIVQSCQEAITNNVALKIVIYTCSGCVSNLKIPENISAEYLFELLKLVVPQIDRLDENGMLSYTQAIFHILKMFVLKENLVLIDRMQDVWLPKFLISKSPKIEDIYNKMASTIYMYMNKCAAKNLIIEESSWLQLNLLMLKIYAHRPTTICFELIYACLLTAKKFSISPELLENYYLELMRHVRQNNVHNSETFSYILRVTSVVYQCNLEKDVNKASAFYEIIKSSWMHLPGEDLMNLYRVLKIPLLLSTRRYNNIREELSSSAKSLELLKHLRNLSSQQYVSESLNRLVSCVMKIYRGNQHKQWQNFSNDTYLEVYGLFYQLANYGNYSSEESIFQSISYAGYITSSIINSLDQDLSFDYHMKSVEYLNGFFNKIRLLKDINCVKWKNAWEIIGIGIYNIGVHLYKKEIKSATYYFNLLIKQYIEFDGQNCLKLKFSMLEASLKCICSLGLDNFKKKMAYAALSILLCPNDAGFFMEIFIDAKRNSADKEIQTLTLVSAFNKFKNEFADCFVSDNYELMLEDRKRLLILELEYYKKKWPSRIPMMNALKELQGIVEVNCIVTVIINVFGDCYTNVHEDVPKILAKIVQQYEKCLGGDKDPEAKFHLSVLYMLQYKYKFKEVLQKHASEMERALAETGNKDELGSGDPNADCDILLSYKALTLKEHHSNISYLNKSFDFLSCISSEDWDSLKKLSIISNVYNHLVRISHEYRLHMHKIKSLHALNLALTNAQNESNAFNIVHVITLIIDNFDISNSYIKYLICLADKEVQFLDTNCTKNLQIVLDFLVAKVKAFMYVDYKEAFKLFKIACDMFNGDSRKDELTLMNSQLLVLDHKFSLLPCKFGIQDHANDSQLKIHTATSRMFDLYKSRKLNTSYEICLLLDTTEELIKFYHLQRLPRKVRAVGKDIIILTQKLILPLRCAVFLDYCAHADLRTGRYDECRVKINGIESILQLRTCTTNKCIRSTKMEDENTQNNKQTEVQKLGLDKPGSQICPLSPGTCIVRFNEPSFLQHNEECVCFCCICLEYQKLIMEKVRLDALLNLKQGNTSKAKEFFESACDLYKTYQAKHENYQNICANFIPCGLIAEFDSAFMFYYASLSLNYSSHLYSMKFTEIAKSVNRELIILLKPKKNEYIHLWNEVLVQKLSYITNSLDPNPIPEMDELSLDDNQNLSKTPESLTTRIKLAVSNLSKTENTHRKLKTSVPFVISPDKENPKTPKKISIFCDATKNMESLKKSVRKKLNPVTRDVASTSISSLVAPAQTSLRTKTGLLAEKVTQSSRQLHSTHIENNSTDNKLQKKLGTIKNNPNEDLSTISHGVATRSSQRLKRK